MKFFVYAKLHWYKYIHKGRKYYTNCENLVLWSFFYFLSQHFSVLEHTFSTIYMERWTWKVKVDFFLHTFSLVSITSSITFVLRLGTTQVWGLVFGLFGGSSWSSKFGIFRPDVLKLPLFWTILPTVCTIKNVMVWRWIDQKSGGFLMAFVCTWKKCSDFCTILHPRRIIKTLITRCSKTFKKSSIWGNRATTCNNISYY